MKNWMCGRSRWVSASLDCVDSDLAKMNEKIYNKITTYAKDLVSTGDAIGREFGVPDRQ